MKVTLISEFDNSPYIIEKYMSSYKIDSADPYFNILHDEICGLIDDSFIGYLDDVTYDKDFNIEQPFNIRVEYPVEKPWYIKTFTYNKGKCIESK